MNPWMCCIYLKTGQIIVTENTTENTPQKVGFLEGKSPCFRFFQVGEIVHNLARLYVVICYFGVI